MGNLIASGSVLPQNASRPISNDLLLIIAGSLPLVSLH